ncbi:hypothetical protein [Corynebacterium lizhenjunii]|uniref:hypothetical protein n=1 Tax=Corynebacterium lizhenjunii TaxID=2709394 RepID=UPI0013EE01A1|nr:hypothetical protein [Corynebacterium lizhenjunii]
MKYLVLRCGFAWAPSSEMLAKLGSVQMHEVGAVPSRQELRVLDAAAREILPVDPTPSLDEIAARPDVAHLGAPGFAPQPVPEPLRVVICGNDAALSAVLTRAMRADYLWVEFAFVPSGESTAAQNWGLPTDAAEAWALAVAGQVRPAPLIRNDAGQAVAGSATITQWEDEAGHTGEITGEVIVDSTVLLRHGEGSGAPGVRSGEPTYGAKLVPMLDAPGIVAARATGPIFGTPPPPRGLRAKLQARMRPVRPGALDDASVLTGRAVQAGGPALRVVVDGVSSKRAVKRVTFYRHLRDLQVVRP